MHYILKQKQVTVYTYMILQNEDKTVYNIINAHRSELSLYQHNIYLIVPEN